MKVPTIILAAGASRRLGRPKQLVQFEGRPLLMRAIEAARSADEVFVVLGATAEEIRRELHGDEFNAVINSEWEEGIASSIRAGVNAAVETQTEGVLLMACDQPRVSAAHLQELRRAFEECGGDRIVASEYAGVVGIPAVFPRAEFAALRALKGDEGARKLLRGAAAKIVAVNFAGGEVDIDTPEDLAALTPS